MGSKRKARRENETLCQLARAGFDRYDRFRTASTCCEARTASKGSLVTPISVVEVALISQTA